MAAGSNARLSATDPVALGPYRLLGRLGGGGMGQVYLGRSPGGRLVAVKVIKPEFATNPEFRMRFAREVANARNVSGMFTAVVADADPDGPVPWLATAYIPGPSLDAVVQESGPLPLASLLPLGAGLAEALAAIHAAGVVHRDLKPSNVLLAADGPRVIDFGIARAAEASRLTQTGDAVGSPGYMSPEQAQGQPVGPATDVFSLGGVLTFAATGEGPFGGGTIHALLYRVVHEAPVLDRVPPQLRPLLQRCLAKDPAARPSPDELLAELDGGPIHESWLPQAVAGTLARYEPSARIAALGAGAPGAGERTFSAVPVPAGPTGPAGPRHRRRQQGSAGGGGRLGPVVTSVVAAAAVAVLVTLVGLNTSIFGRSPVSHAQTAGSSGPATTSTVTATRASTTASASPVQTTSSAPPAAQAAPPGPSYPCTDRVITSTNGNGVSVPAGGAPVDPTPPAVLSKGGVDTSTPLTRLQPGQDVSGTCHYYTEAPRGYDWYMQVHLSSGGYGYIWIQYLVTGEGHRCEKDGKNIFIPAAFNAEGSCPLLPLDEAPVSS